MTIPETLNLAYIDRQYEAWKKDPDAVTRDWRFFFEGFEMAGKTVLSDGKLPSEGQTSLMPPDACTLDKALLQSRVEALKYRYRDLGHLLACLDPLAVCPTSHPLLDLEAFGLTPADLSTEFYTRRFSETRSAPLKDIIRELRETYCRSVGVEYMHLQDPEERKWLQDRMEPARNRPSLEAAMRLRILNKLCQSAVFEGYLHKKYIGQTRFSLEGADTLIPMMDALFLHASGQGVTEVILGMAHRGRLNVLTNLLFKPYEEVFREFINTYNPESLVGAGDVKYHNGYLTDISLANGKDLRIFLVNNPSHLESVDPVVEGVAFGRQGLLGNGSRRQVMPLLIHGDAAFAGQGVVMETLNLSQLEGYKTGGTIHIIINNQIGYTTLPEHARSTRYSTDVAKMLMVPIFHVHGENPEAAVHVVKLACDYRMAFEKDVIIDLVCYRRYGHNEGDEPYFTQPKMYERIRERPSLHVHYARQLMDAGGTGPDTLDTIVSGVEHCLDAAFEAARNNPNVFPPLKFYENAAPYHGQYSHDPVDTGVEMAALQSLGRRLNRFPEGFSLHPKLERLFKARQDGIETGRGIDWAAAEALAFASLVSEGVSVRLSGQDSGRGTFSQRHSVVVDARTGVPVIPLQSVCEKSASFTVLNSSLSEAGVLGFEYGYSLVRADGLILWEAQFGDFANNAQSVIDLFIVSGETKWRRLSGLVLLLPHGWEGLGPEHSSARLERFLQLCAHDNIQVLNMTTPAQYFHALRRQVRSPWRKPLVIMAPKSLLRLPEAVSDLSDLAEGRFETVLDDPAKIDRPIRVIFCSGKIYYSLLQRRETLKAHTIALIRVEQLYPFPEKRLSALVRKYSRTREWFWVQEEPENMGAWRFMAPRLEKLTGKPVHYVGRPEAASPATGFANLYKQEQAAIPDQAVGQISGIQTG